MIEGFKAVVRPFMAVSGWIMLGVMLVEAYVTGRAYPPVWVISILLAPSITWFGLRFVQKQRV